MIEEILREPIVRLSNSRMVELEKSLKSDIGKVAANWSSRGFSISSGRVVDTKATAERNLIKRAETIKDAIIEVCDARNVGRRPNLRQDLQKQFDELYDSQLENVRNLVGRSIPSEAKKLCPIGDANPEIQMYREELSMFSERLPQKDYWANVTLWFRSRWWSVPFVLIAVILPLLVKWVEMLKFLLQWAGILK